MCLFFRLNVLLFAIDITVWQSQCIDIECVGCIPKGKLGPLSQGLLESSSPSTDHSTIYEKFVIDKYPEAEN